LIKKKPQ